MKNNHKLHYFQLISASLWPFFISCNIFSLFINFIFYLNACNFINGVNLLINFIVILLIVLLWWRDMFREAAFGLHTNNVQTNIRLGMILFIVSEIMLFFPFFWSFFTGAFSPTIDIYCQWPPIGLETISPFGLALAGTLILLSSGFSITVAHYSILKGDLKKFKLFMLFTIILAFSFLFIQLFEYSESSFNISDSAYASNFYILTGLHGMHVFVGTSFIIYCLVISFQYTVVDHLSFELCSWYWHFVDIVW
jgi:cytochrome c oxidase subunit 3